MGWWRSILRWFAPLAENVVEGFKGLGSNRGSEVLADARVEIVVAWHDRKVPPKPDRIAGDTNGLDSACQVPNDSEHGFSAGPTPRDMPRRVAVARRRRAR